MYRDACPGRWVWAVSARATHPGWCASKTANELRMLRNSLRLCVGSTELSADNWSIDVSGERHARQRRWQELEGEMLRPIRGWGTLPVVYMTFFKCRLFIGGRPSKSHPRIR